MLRFLLAASAAVMIPASASAVELILNGGFEADTVNNSCCLTFPPSSPASWTATPNVNVVIGTFGSSAGNLAIQGNQYLDLIGEGQTGGISQTFATVTGQAYNLSFIYSHNLFSGTPSASASYAISGSQGPFGGTIFHTGGSTSNLNWLTFSNTFIATGTSATLSFINLTGATNAGVLLDAISVSAVPEPSAWAMMLFGFGAIGFALRRRRSLALAAA